MIPAVRRDLVARARDPLHEIGMPLRHPADHEERAPGLVARQQIEQPGQALSEAGFEATPIAARHARFERRHLEVFFDVDGEMVLDHMGVGCNACA